MKTSRDYAIQCIKDEAGAVLGLIPQLDERFDEAVELMYHCTGKIIVPCKYYAYNPFSEGLAALQDKQNGKWGFVDKEGKSTFDYQ